MSAGNGTSADDDRMQVDSVKKGKAKGKSKHQSRALQTSTWSRTVAELDIGRKTLGDQVEERTAIRSVTTATRRKARVTRKAKGKSKHVDVVETNQPSETASNVSHPSQTPSTIGEHSCNSNVEPWNMGATVISVSTRRQSGAE